MAKTQTTWQKGQSGNPSGRKPKGRALTDILQKAGASPVEVQGKSVASKRVVAQLLWELAATGKAEFPGGRALEIAPQDWLVIVKFLYQHIDGPPKDNPSGTEGDPYHVKHILAKGYVEVTPDDWDEESSTTDSDV